MLQLQCVYLMNITLYLKLTDIKNFIQVSHKSKDACDGLKINPINDDEIPLPKSLKIIMNSFPRLQTLHLTQKSFGMICSNPESFVLPNVYLFKTNDYALLNSITNNKTITMGIDRIQINIRDLQGIVLENVRYVKTSVYMIDSLKHLMDQTNSIKVIYLFGCVDDLISMSKGINAIAPNNTVILQITHDSDKSTVLPKLKTLPNILDKSILIEYHYNYGIKEYYRISDVPQTETDFSGELWYNRIEKDYLPFKIEIRADINFYCNVTELKTVTSVIIKSDGYYELPQSTEIIQTQQWGKVFIKNWDELTNVHLIQHNNYNINTPKPYQQYEYNMKKKSIKEKIYCSCGLLRLLIGFFSFISLLSSIFNNGSFNFHDHLVSLFPYIVISTLLYFSLLYFILFTGIFKEIGEGETITKVIISLALLFATQCIGVLIYDQRNYSSYFSEISFILFFAIMVHIADFLVFSVGFGDGYLKRKMVNLNISDYWAHRIYSNLIELIFKNKVTHFLIALSFTYTYATSLFSTTGLLFVTNIINTTTAILASIYFFLVW